MAAEKNLLRESGPWTREAEKQTVIPPAPQVVPKIEEGKDCVEDYTTEKELKDLLIGHVSPKDHLTYLEMCVGLTVDDFF
jgi:hypothetical protein